MLTYSEALDLLNSARDRKAGKPIANNTRLFERNGCDIAVRLHNTDVITIHPNDTYTLQVSGHWTATTKSRINRYSPARIYQEDYCWYHADGTPFEDGDTIDRYGNVLEDVHLVQRETLDSHESDYATLRATKNKMDAVKFADDARATQKRYGVSADVRIRTERLPRGVADAIVSHWEEA